MGCVGVTEVFGFEPVGKTVFIAIEELVSTDIDSAIPDSCFAVYICFFGLGRKVGVACVDSG